MTSSRGHGTAKPISEAERALRLMELQQRQAIDRLERQRRLVDRAERALARRRSEQLELMLAARQVGCTWDDLASSSDVTRQAVQQRVRAALDSPE